MARYAGCRDILQIMLTTVLDTIQPINHPSLNPIQCFNPFPISKSLDSSKLKEFADNNFKFDENGSKLSKRIKNIVGKGEIAHYEQFLLFPQCFQKACFPAAS